MVVATDPLDAAASDIPAVASVRTSALASGSRGSSVISSSMSIIGVLADELDDARCTSSAAASSSDAASGSVSDTATATVSGANETAVDVDVVVVVVVVEVDVGMSVVAWIGC